MKIPKSQVSYVNMVHKCPVALANNLVTTKGHALIRTKQTSNNQRGEGVDQD